MKKGIYYFVFLALTFTVLFNCQKSDSIPAGPKEYNQLNQEEVNPDVVILNVDDSNILIEDYDVNTGAYSVTFSDSIPKILTSSILVIDRDTVGYIRKVVTLIQNDNTIEVSTSQATLEDVFSDTDFKLTTGVLASKQNLKKLSAKAIGTHMTDESGYIHPVEIFNHNEEGFELVHSVLEEVSDKISEDAKMYKKWDFSQTDFFNEEYGRLYIDEGYFEFEPTINFEFEFGIFNSFRGKTSRFLVQSENKANFKTTLKLEANYDFEKTNTLTLKKDLIKKRIKFLVFGVPVWITIDTDLIAENYLKIDAMANASVGVESNRTITTGLLYENLNWDKINLYSKKDTIYPLQVEGNASLFNRFEVYPSTEIELYDVIGPYFDIVPYLEGEANISLDLNRDSSIKVGLDARIGMKEVDVPIIGYEIPPVGGDNINIFDYTLWDAPLAIEIIGGDNQTGEISNVLINPVMVKVVDNRGWACPLVLVYFETTDGNGTPNKSKILTDVNGVAEVIWSSGNLEGEQSLFSYIKDGSDKEIENSRVSIKSLISLPLDTDADGVIDEIDICPNTPEGELADSTGCSVSQKDSDSDGVMDNVDACSDTPIGELVDNTGCSDSQKDSDLDGIMDNVDSCSDTPIGETVDSSGCSISPSDAIQFNPNLSYGSVTDIEGNTYKTIQIGTQTWMAENLKTTKYRNGNPIPNVTGMTEWLNLSTGAFVNYNNDVSNTSIYGRIYNWYAADDNRGLCPQGWHVPSDDEWKTLEMYLGMPIEQANNMGMRGYNQEGGKLKEIGTTHWSLDLNDGVTNSSGFTALPGGTYYPTSVNGDFHSLGVWGYWWTSTTAPTPTDPNVSAWGRGLRWGTSIYRNNMVKIQGLCVRCVKD